MQSQQWMWKRSIFLRSQWTTGCSPPHAKGIFCLVPLLAKLCPHVPSGHPAICGSVSPSFFLLSLVANHFFSVHLLSSHHILLLSLFTSLTLFRISQFPKFVHYWKDLLGPLSIRFPHWYCNLFFLHCQTILCYTTLRSQSHARVKCDSTHPPAKLKNAAWMKHNFCPTGLTVK